MALKNMFFVKAAVATLGKGGTAALATTVALYWPRTVMVEAMQPVILSLIHI